MADCMALVRFELPGQGDLAERRIGLGAECDQPPDHDGAHAETFETTSPDGDQITVTVTWRRNGN
jgi:hypothetical protein